jgi:hypothetical protein
LHLGDEIGVAGREYGTGMIRSTFAAVPRRGIAVTGPG